MQKILENLELILTAAGVALIAAAFAIFRNLSPWKAAAVCALSVGVLHGIIFYAVRSAQRKIRHRAVRSIRYKLQDVVFEKLQLLLISQEKDEFGSSASYAIQDIERCLAIIEAESLMTGRFE